MFFKMLRAFEENRDVAATNNKAFTYGISVKNHGRDKFYRHDVRRKEQQIKED